MITEAQRRALFALREALHLCRSANVVVRASEGDTMGLFIDGAIEIGGNALTDTTVSEVISWYPEPEQ